MLSRLPYLGIAALGAILLITTSYAQVPSPVTPGVEVQTRGPVHEAFAQGYEPVQGPGPLVPKEPPPAIRELAPQERPQGDNVQWIGGYWSWDSERNDFVWVSGTFRNPPPGRQFAPGHWVNTPEGWRWVPGFWAPDGQTEIPYTAEPPAPLATDPSMPPPDANSMYIPGNWAFSDGAFAWRPGYYSPYRPGRVWTPARYIWTPAGYVYVGGYWDYPFEDRGMLFAPVSFTSPLWETAGWYYRPNYYVLGSALVDSLFWRGGGYYFGNYYGQAYSRLGYSPWFARGYDPLFNYYRWHNGGNSAWVAGHQRAFNDRVAGRAAGPPRTFAQQTAGNRVVMPLSQASNDLRMTRFAPAPTNIQQTSRLSQTRIQNESGVRGGARGPDTQGPVTIARPSPIVNNAITAPQVTSPRVVTPQNAAPRVTSAPITTNRATSAPVAPRATAPSAPRIATPNVAPHVAAPQIAPRVAPAPRVTAPQTRSHAPAPVHHAASTASHAPSRAVSHSSGRSGHKR